jgi:hypothetical protein
VDLIEPAPEPFCSRFAVALAAEEAAHLRERLFRAPFACRVRHRKGDFPQGRQQHLDRHRPVERLFARSAAGIAGMERAQIDRIDRVADEIGKMPFMQPVLQRMEQQHLLLWLVG